VKEDVINSIEHNSNRNKTLYDLKLISNHEILLLTEITPLQVV